MPIKIANAPCSWGVLEFELEEKGEAIGYAQVLDEIRETGYDGTELGDWGFMPTDPPALIAELHKRNLELLGAFVPVAFAQQENHADGEATALKTARLLKESAGSDAVIVLADENGTDTVRTQYAGRILPQHGLSNEQWKVFAEGVNRIAQTVHRETGLRTVFHHHCAGFVETPEEIQELATRTDPNMVGFCFDTGHYRFGGGSPIDGFRQLKDRIWHVHFKDCSPSVREDVSKNNWSYFEALKHGLFCELGQGEIEFSAIASELQANDYPGWIVVEQDVLPGMGAPKECARRNREFLRSCDL